MEYSKEFKLECVHLYKDTGTYSPTSEVWTRIYEKHGTDILKYLDENQNWMLEDMLVLINQYKVDKSISSVAVEAEIGDSLLYNWIRKID